MAQQARPKLRVHREDLRAWGEELVGLGDDGVGKNVLEDAVGRPIAPARLISLAELYLHWRTPFRQLYTTPKKRTAMKMSIS